MNSTANSLQLSQSQINASALTRRARIASVSLQLVAAGILAMTLPYKFGGAADTRALFDELGAGAAGMYGTAVLETIAVIALLTPRLAALGGALAAGLMSGAIFSHLTVLGVDYGDGSLFPLAVIAFTAAASVTFLRRRELPIVGSFFQE